MYFNVGTLLSFAPVKLLIPVACFSSQQLLRVWSCDSITAGNSITLDFFEQPLKQNDQQQILRKINFYKFFVFIRKDVGVSGPFVTHYNCLHRVVLRKGFLNF